MSNFKEMQYPTRQDMRNEIARQNNRIAELEAQLCESDTQRAIWRQDCLKFEQQLEDWKGKTYFSWSKEKELLQQNSKLAEAVLAAHRYKGELAYPNCVVEPGLLSNERKPCQCPACTLAREIMEDSK